MAEGGGAAFQLNQIIQKRPNNSELKRLLGEKVQKYKQDKKEYLNRKNKERKAQARMVRKKALNEVSDYEREIKEELPKVDELLRDLQVRL